MPQTLGKLCSLGPDAVVGFLILRPGNARDRRPDGTVVVERLFFNVVEEGAEGVEILLRGGVVFVIVADGATDGQSHERSPVGLGALARDVDAEFLGNGSTFVAADAQAHVAAGDEGVEIFGRHQVAGNLLHGELVEGLVAVEGADEVVAPGPYVAAVVVMQAIRVGIAGVVEPIAGALLAISGPGQKRIDQVLIGLRRGVVHEGADFGGGGQQAGQVKRYAADEGSSVGFRRGVQAFFLETGEDEGVDGILGPCFVLSGQGHERADGLVKGPVGAVHRAFLYPLLQNGDIRGLHRLGFALGILRHQVVRVSRFDPLDEFALLRMAGNNGVGMAAAFSEC